MNLEKLNEHAFYLHLNHEEILDNGRMYQAAFIYQDLANLPDQFLILKDRFDEAPRLVVRSELGKALTRVKEFYNPPEIKVTITGPTSSGRTTVAEIIGRALLLKALPVNVESLDGDFLARDKSLSKALSEMRASGVSVKIIDNNEK
jgi:hypothetical protein